MLTDLYKTLTPETPSMNVKCLLTENFTMLGVKQIYLLKNYLDTFLYGRTLGINFSPYVFTEAIKDYIE